LRVEPQPGGPSAPRPGDARVLGLLSGRREKRPPRKERHLEQFWYECLSYPVRAWPLCVGLAVALTLLSAAIVVILPRLLADAPAEGWTLALVRSSWVLILVLIVGVPSSFLECVVASATRGEAGALPFSGGLLLAVARSGLRWLVCFFAGPVLFAGIGFLYWLDCGDPGPLDWLILLEVGTVGIAYQFFAVLAINDRGRLRDLNPLAIVDLVHRMGGRGLAVALVAASLLLVHAFAVFSFVPLVHTNLLAALGVLAGIWLSGVWWSTFFCRLLGIWCYRSRRLSASVSDSQAPAAAR
jgi:hypothetical protein